MLATNFHKPRLFEMKIGMLWFDNDTSVSLDKKIARAVAYYQKKYGQHPTICYVHASMVADIPNSDETKYRRFGSVEVRDVNWVLPNHFWIGTNGGDT